MGARSSWTSLLSPSRRPSLSRFSWGGENSSSSSTRRGSARRGLPPIHSPRAKFLEE